MSGPEDRSGDADLETPLAEVPLSGALWWEPVRCV